MKFIVLIGLIFGFSRALLADDKVIEGHDHINEIVFSAHDKDKLSSNGSLTREGYSESKGLVSINTKVEHFEVFDADHVKYQNLESVKLSIAVTPLQNALAAGMPDKDLVKIQVNGTVELSSGTKKDTEKITCKLYNGKVARAYRINTDRLLECWAETDESGLDTPKFEFAFWGTVPKGHQEP